MFVATTTPTELGWASGVVVAINMALLAELPWVGGDGRWLSTIPKPETEHDSAFGLRISTFFRPSAFELRASDLIVACLLASIIISLLWLRCSAADSIASPAHHPETQCRARFGLRPSGFGFRPSGFGFDPRGPRSAGRLRSSLTSPRLLRFARSAH